MRGSVNPRINGLRRAKVNSRVMAGSRGVLLLALVVVATRVHLRSIIGSSAIKQNVKIAVCRERSRAIKGKGGTGGRGAPRVGADGFVEAAFPNRRASGRRLKELENSEAGLSRDTQTRARPIRCTEAGAKWTRRTGRASRTSTTPRPTERGSPTRQCDSIRHQTCPSLVVNC